MIDPQRNTYDSIFKAIGLFGGVRVFQILINIVRSKLIAVLIGPAGMGIAGLLQSTIQLVNQLTGFGLETSAVREISKEVSDGKTEKIDEVMSVLKRLVIITGFLGTIVVFLFASQLSVFAFGNEEYTNAFRIISVVLLLMQLTTGQIAVLQGTFQYRLLAKASLYGAILSLVIVCPIYYFLRERGIPLAIIAASLCTLLFSWLYSKRIHYNTIQFPFVVFIKKGKAMIFLGFVLALGATVSTLSGYLFNIFLSTYGNVSIVGLYQAAFQITNSYVMLIFSAMSTDYIPRLSAMCGDNEGQVSIINKQAILVLILVTPLLALMMVFSNEVISLLYSKEFVTIAKLLAILMLGMIFRAVSWCLSYSLIARGDSKAFLFCEVTISITSLLFKILGYTYGGFEGMGVGFVLNYILYTVILLLMTKRLFSFSLSREFTVMLVKSILLISVCLIIVVLCNEVLKYLLGLILIFITFLNSYREISKRVDLSGIVKHTLRRG